MSDTQSKEEKLEYINKAAMKIILHAGDARAMIMDSLELIAIKQYDKAERKMDTAYEEIKLAHKAQTKIIQEEVAGEDIPHTLLFAHAQDTLMTIYTEYNLTKKFIVIFQNLKK
ncbi:PTS lactose/cellobiose transporter subunit IIA [Shouchella tritolerans]|uniref:PTS lactose/cellobiose transporter subunit IIA n=1 Tax=Shouchella tritolerans TaxID=2979466 RepID=UPI0021E92C4B|nr:PTS lactose/cellobiose transporter subunit IIA [Shouchella tritolerans]